MQLGTKLLQTGNWPSLSQWFGHVHHNDILSVLSWLWRVLHRRAGWDHSLFFRPVSAVGFLVITFHDTSWGSEQALSLVPYKNGERGYFWNGPPMWVWVESAGPGLVPWVQSRPLLQSAAVERWAVATGAPPGRAPPPRGRGNLSRLLLTDVMLWSGRPSAVSSRTPQRENRRGVQCKLLLLRDHKLLIRL